MGNIYFKTQAEAEEFCDKMGIKNYEIWFNYGENAYDVGVFDEDDNFESMLKMEE